MKTRSLPSLHLYPLMLWCFIAFFFISPVAVSCPLSPSSSPLAEAPCAWARACVCVAVFEWILCVTDGWFLHLLSWESVREKQSGPSQKLKFMFSVCQLRAALPNICDSFSHPPSSLLSFPGPPVCFATRGELLWWELKVSILFLTASVCKSQSVIFWTPGWIWFHFYFVSHLIFTLFQQKKIAYKTSLSLSFQQF